MDRPNNAQIFQNVRRLGLDILSAFPNLSSPRPQRFVAWVPPPDMALALNTDESSLGNPGEAGIDGVFRDASGTWVLGYFSSIGVASIIVAELKAILFGLQIAWDKHYQKINCFTDSTHAIKLITDQDITYHPLATVISDIRELLNRSWTVTISHLLRKGKEVADRLAKKGASCGDFNLQILQDPFPKLSPVLLADALGLQRLRL